MTNEWRAVLAALANADASSVYAETVLGLSGSATLSSKKRNRAVAILRNAGLVSVKEDGTLTLIPDALAGVLELSADPKREGVDRFVSNGRIERYPIRSSDRLDVLKWVVDQAIQPDEVLTEVEINARLAPFDPDVAALRRYLVDAELLLRTRSGTSYSRT